MTHVFPTFRQLWSSPYAAWITAPVVPGTDGSDHDPHSSEGDVVGAGFVGLLRFTKQWLDS